MASFYETNALCIWYRPKGLHTYNFFLWMVSVNLYQLPSPHMGNFFTYIQLIYIQTWFLLVKFRSRAKAMSFGT